ncbi:hypothetical protein ACF0H5_021467 [Mactra antiquata]
MSSQIYHLIFFAVVHSLLFSTIVTQPMEYTYYKSLELDANYILGWRYNATHIEFQATVNTAGYVGFGLTRSGQMYNADIVMGWIAGGSIYFADYHTNASSRAPMMDQSQDWFIKSGNEVNGTTVLEFYRKLDTCDRNDMAITKDRIVLIWSYSPNDPDLATSEVPYHGEYYRGVVVIFLLESDRVPMSYPPPESYNIELRNANFEIPANGSSLQCIVFNLTETITSKSHLIKFAPIITPGNEPYVYRMMLYRCEITDPTVVYKVSRHCQYESPVSVKSCKSVVASWSMGGETFHFPDNIGIPMQGPTDPSTYVLEIHYSRFSEADQAQPDSSGLSLTYTHTNLANDAGMVEIGKVISPGWRQFLPNGVSDFRTASLCSPRCMSWGFGTPEGQIDSVQILGVMFKGNDVVKEIRLRHYRENMELPVISMDRKFSNFYQGPRLLASPVTLQSNDSLAVECVFDTTNRTFVTRGGWSRIEEVCRATVVYYPAKKFDLCLSWSSFDKLISRENKLVEEVGAVKYLSNITQWEPAYTKKYQKALNLSKERSICSSIQRSPAYAIDRFKPKIIRPYKEQKPCA